MNHEQQVRFNMVLAYISKGEDVPPTDVLDRILKWVMHGTPNSIVPVSGFTVQSN
jgi:hypothetical protein